MRRIANGDDAMDTSSSQEPEQHRQVLSQLRTMGKQKQAPINRAGSAIQGMCHTRTESQTLMNTSVSDRINRLQGED